MTNCYKISSDLNAAHGFNYLKDKKPVSVMIPGRYTVKDKEKPFCYITEEDCKELKKSEHGGIDSPFSILLKKGINGGIIAEKVKFADMPDEWQKQLDPDEYAKLQLKKPGTEG